MLFMKGIHLWPLVPSQSFRNTKNIFMLWCKHDCMVDDHPPESSMQYANTNAYRKQIQYFSQVAHFSRMLDSSIE